MSFLSPEKLYTNDVPIKTASNCPSHQSKKCGPFFDNYVSIFIHLSPIVAFIVPLTLCLSICCYCSPFNVTTNQKNPLNR